MSDVTIDEHGRPEAPLAADEMPTLVGFLDYQRATLEWKTRGLDDDQLRVAVATSAITLGSMLKHLAWVEDYWFTLIVGETRPPELWAGVDWDADPDWEWHSAAADAGDLLRSLWADSVARSRAVVQAELSGGTAQGLARTHAAWDGQGQVSLRWVLVHMIEEYARHNGHADLIRESIDGETGE
jgi:uncharacterized damage-inducible protein DinB